MIDDAFKHIDDALYAHDVFNLLIDFFLHADVLVAALI